MQHPHVISRLMKSERRKKVTTVKRIRNIFYSFRQAFHLRLCVEFGFTIKYGFRMKVFTYYLLLTLSYAMKHVIIMFALISSYCLHHNRFGKALSNCVPIYLTRSIRKQMNVFPLFSCSNNWFGVTQIINRSMPWRPIALTLFPLIKCEIFEFVLCLVFANRAAKTRNECLFKAFINFLRLSHHLTVYRYSAISIRSSVDKEYKSKEYKSIFVAKIMSSRSRKKWK